MQSPILRAFYKAYAEWLKAGAPKTDPSFKRHWGLCHALRCYVENHWYTIKDFHPDVGQASITQATFFEMQTQFEIAGLDGMFPFNRGSADDYDMESHVGRMHLNEQRIEWVNQHAA